MERIPSNQVEKKNKIPQGDYSRQQASRTESSSRKLDERTLLENYSKVYKQRLKEQGLNSGEINKVGYILEAKQKTGKWGYGGKDREYLKNEVERDFKNFKDSK